MARLKTTLSRNASLLCAASAAALLITATGGVNDQAAARASRAKQAETTEAAPAPLPSKPDDPGCKACVAAAATQFAQGNMKQAADKLLEWTERCPHSTQLHLMLSTILVRTGDRTGAEEAAARAVASAPSSVPANLQYGLAAMANRHFVKAKEQFDRVTELDPGSYEAWSSLAMINKDLHYDEEATKCAAKAADLEPGTKAVRMATLLNLKRTGKFAQAKVELKRLLSETNVSPESAGVLAREAMLIGAFTEAVDACKRVSTAYPRATAPLLMSALAHYCLHEYADCADNADRIIALDENNPDAAALKAMALSQQNKLEEADTALKGAIASDSSSSLVLLGRGTLALAHGSLVDSETLLQTCLSNDGSNASMQGIPHALAHLALADVYTKTGKTSEAADQAKAVAADKRFGK